ncbi:hypothetical protein QE152_g5808 [Popillia japonica]|uniref:Reverse transcriptase domain-containing protein n=1 Tax=Popillia japonica TaxID=7064 RepID=A0AAW1ML28_POPJA
MFRVKDTMHNPDRQEAIRASWTKLLISDLIPRVECSHRKTVVYADDIIIIVESDGQQDLMFKASEAIEELVTWMSAHDLESLWNPTANKTSCSRLARQ